MTATEERPAAEVGSPRKRKEDARLITGRTRWTDNIQLPGMLHLSVARSPMAHARITGIDTTAAGQAPGVLGVFTAADLGAEQVGLPCAWTVTPDMKAPQRPVLASDTVHFAGEGVAVVVARTPAEARDAVELVEVDYDPLPPVLDMEAALAEGAPLVHPDLGTNRNALWVFDSAGAGTGGSVEDAIAAAEADPDSIVLRRRFIQQRLVPAFMEPRSTVVDPNGEQLTMWSSTQVPHILKTMTALTLGLPEHKLRVIAPDVGGGFGGKLTVTPEELLTLLVARKLKRPVKWTESRSESILTAHHGRAQIQDITLAARKDGTVTGLKVELMTWAPTSD
jgi:aerobic carbon-monoxide dehydrogenase large subunit